MTIKVIIFDVDWVLLQVPHYFSQEIEKRGYKNAVTVLGDFYKNKRFKSRGLNAIYELTKKRIELNIY